MTELFDRDVKTIGKHINNALKEELDNAVVAKFATTASDGKTYQVEYNNPFCVKCYEEGHLTKATVVDHIKPHRGDQKIFWDWGNWQSLCEHHHNVKTMTEDRYVEYRF